MIRLLRRLEQGLIRIILNLTADYYLKKPDIKELLLVKYPTFKSALYGFINELFYLLKLERGFKLTSLNIEITNLCNLQCKICPVPFQMTRKKGFIEPEFFKRIVDDNPQLDFILPFQWGEPLLHPQFFELIKCAKQKGIRTMITTNGTLLTDRTIEKLLDSGLERITFSIDGTSETHTRIRGFEYGRLKEDIMRLKKARDILRSDLKIDITMVVFEGTEEKVEDFFRDWRGIADRVQVVPKMESQTRKHRCRELWRGGLVVLWDGRVTPCCVDFDGKLIVGDARKEALSKIWNGEKMRYLRRMQAKGKFFGICKDCGEYKSPKVSPRFS